MVLSQQVLFQSHCTSLELSEQMVSLKESPRLI